MTLYKKDFYDMDDGKDVTCSGLLKLLKYRLKIITIISITSGSILYTELVAVLSLTAEGRVPGPMFSMHLQKER